MTKYQDLIYTILKIIVGLLIILTIIEGSRFIGKNISYTIESINQKITSIYEKTNIIDKRITTEIFLIKEDINLQLHKAKAEQESQITNILNKKEFERLVLEKKLQQINIMVVNNSIGAGGSGVSLKYKDKYYILTAGHMLDKITDELLLMENGNIIDTLKVVKWDYIGLNDVENPNDLLLLIPSNPTIRPKVYAELASIEPQSPEHVYHVGNPAGVEDLVSDCRVILYKNRFMYIHGTAFYGSSGCGIYNYNGELVGILSHGRTATENGETFTINGVVRLNEIKEFFENAYIEGLLDE